MVLFIKITFLQSDIESLHNAAQGGDLSKVKELIAKNKRLIYSRDASGASALHKAAKDGHTGGTDQKSYGNAKIW